MPPFKFPRVFINPAAVFLCVMLALAVPRAALAQSSALTVGPNVNISKYSGDNCEETIAINPANPLNLFASETYSLVTKFSLDGGTTWSNCDVSALGSSIGDVSSAFDGYGNLFLVRFGASTRVALGLSTNGGATFSLLYQTTSTGNDQPTVTVGPSSTPGQGSVWITYTEKSGQLVTQGASVTGLGSVGSFSAADNAPGGGTGDFGDIVVGPSGQVMVVYQNSTTTLGPDNLYLNLDPLGLGGGLGSQSIASPTQVGSFTPLPAQPVRTVDAESGLAWDRSGGPYQGRLYLVYTDRPSTNSVDTDIFLRHSDDSGTTWSAPVRVNDDPVGNGKSQFLPRLALDQTSGYIAVSFYDCRNSVSNTLTEFWAAVSTNGGESFLPNVKVSAGASSALVPAIVNARFKLDYGDYSGLTFYGGVFYPCWADNSNSTGDNPDGAMNYFDIYTARVTVNTPVTMLNPRYHGTAFVVTVKTTVGQTYYLESSPTLINPTWSAAPGVTGNGLFLDLTNSTTAPQNFFRVRAQ